MAKATFLLLTCLAAVAVEAQVSKCPGRNGYVRADTGETGACICGTPCKWAWHCPWESDGSVSGYGCDKIKYDCGDAANIATLIKYYEKNMAAPKEWGVVRTTYTLACLKSQCADGPPPGPKPGSTVAAVASAAPCNPSTCSTGLSCADDAGFKCGANLDWSFCGTKANRMYCPYGGSMFNAMCMDGSCMNTEAECASLGGVKFGVAHCPATARLLFA